MCSEDELRNNYCYLPENINVFVLRTESETTMQAPNYCYLLENIKCICSEDGVRNNDPDAQLLLFT